MDKPPMREGPTLACYRAEKRLQVVGVPPIVIVKICHVPGISEIRENAAQDTSVARRVQTSMSDGSGIARIEEIGRDIRRSAIQALDNVGEGSQWCVDPDEQLDPECFRLRKDRRHRIQRRLTSHCRRNHCHIEWPGGVIFRSKDTPTLLELVG